jgi:MFS superfamily sulfate permease-like transporter
MTGFIFGLAIDIAANQTPKIFGLPKGHGENIDQLWHLLGQLGGTHWATFAVGTAIQFCAIATRYDKTARNFLAAVHLAAATIWLN